MLKSARLRGLFLFAMSFLTAGAPIALAAGDAKAEETNWTSWSFMPENINFSYGQKTDYLYFVIMVIVAIMFFATEGCLLYFMWKYRRREGHKATYTHGNNTIEVAWTLAPALVLIWLALYQRDTWSQIKMDLPAEKDALVVQVYPQQFQWDFRYGGKDGKFATKDDVYTPQLFVPVSEKVVLKMTSKDVIHSFFVPYLRVKQDIVPGMLTRVWFTADRIPLWDLKKQEMVFVTAADFDTKRVGNAKDFAWKEEVLGTSGRKKLSYEAKERKAGPAKGQKVCELYFQGEVQKDVPCEQAEYVLHRVEIACAELCGLGHTTMRAMLQILPKKRYDEVMAKAERLAEEEAPPAGTAKWGKIWDKFHADYNTPMGAGH
ncbi:MAG: cytochrome c oxidase subunit II [Planctomycetes bacterium]|nr:cytochrome c oxidase subunit II [Planctomycetota bacterium]